LSSAIVSSASYQIIIVMIFNLA